MKRALTLTLTMALVGSLMFMGFAGTAAAQNVSFDDIDIDQTSGDATNEVAINQENNNAQVGISDAGAYGDDAAAASSVNQVQVAEQSNYAEVDQYAETGDNEVEFEVEIAEILANG